MNAKELRIGNYFCIINREGEVHIPIINHPFKVVAIHQNCIEYCKINENPAQLKKIRKIEHYNTAPIPITKEKLIGSGFSGTNVSVFHSKEINDNIEIHFSIGGGVINCELICSYLHADDREDRTVVYLPIKYFHQLQNLWFDLSGEELL